MDVFWASWEFIRIFKRNNKKVENEIWGNLRSTDGKHRKHSSLVTRSNLLDHELNTKNKFVFLPRVTLTTWLTTCQWASDSLQFVQITNVIPLYTFVTCLRIVYLISFDLFCIPWLDNSVTNSMTSSVWDGLSLFGLGFLLWWLHGTQRGRLNQAP